MVSAVRIALFGAVLVGCGLSGLDPARAASVLGVDAPAPGSPDLWEAQQSAAGAMAATGGAPALSDPEGDMGFAAGLDWDAASGLGGDLPVVFPAFPPGLLDLVIRDADGE